MPHQVSVIASIDGYIEKWHRTTESRKKFAKIRDKIATIVSLEGVKVDILAPLSGNIISCAIEVGAFVEQGSVIASMRPCEHPGIFNSMCVSCGDIISLAKTSSESLPPTTRDMNTGNSSISNSNISLSGSGHVTVMTSGRQIQLTKSEAEYFQVAKQTGLRSAKKLALVLDLDHTLIHACERGWPTTADENKRGIYSVSLEENALSGIRHYLVKFRPCLKEFLDEANQICQLSIYTAGTRKYAEGLAELMDPEHKLFQGRIVSRSDTVGQSYEDKAPLIAVDKSLSRMFLGDTSLAVILDDREDVWKGKQGHQLLLVRPYKYFLDAQEVNNGAGPTSAISMNQSEQQPAVLLSSDPPGKPSSPNQNAVESDDQLMRSLQIIREIHASIFSPLKSTVNPPLKVSAAIKRMKMSILRGCLLTFSGVIPVNFPNPENHFLWKIATSLGAKVSTELSIQTTHLITTTLQSTKVNKCKNRTDIWILHPDWLFYCRWALAKAIESTFSLVPLDPANLPNPRMLAVSEDDYNNCDESDADEASESHGTNNYGSAENRKRISYDDDPDSENRNPLKRSRIRDADEESNYDNEDSSDVSVLNTETLLNANSESVESSLRDENVVDDDKSSSSDDDWDLEEALKDT